LEGWYAMNSQQPIRCTAFDGFQKIASGNLVDVALASKKYLDRTRHAAVLIFDDASSELIEIDFRGTPAEVRARLANKQCPATDPPRPIGQAQRGPGRPKLGVVAREVTLLPRHWDWLKSQPGGASVALRKLVDEARRTRAGHDRIRRAQEVVYRFMSALAGNLPGFEEASRGLFAGNKQHFEQQIADWPADVRAHAQKLAAPAFEID
jgi:uncharacterized protein